MHNYLKVFIVLFLGSVFNIEAQRFKIPQIFGKKKGSTQWYGDPVSERKVKNNYNIYSTVGLGGGTSNYYGEMTSYKYPIATILKSTRWNLSANYTKHYSYRFAARIGFSYARIAGDDANFENATGAYLQKYARGLHFRNDLKEFSLVGIYDFTKYRKGGYAMRPKIIPYAFLGVSLANHNPRARGETDAAGVVAKDWLKLREFDTEGQVSDLNGKQYSTIAFAIPFGAGIRIKIHEQFDISLEGGLRYTFLKGGRYLDDVSENYIVGSDVSSSNNDKFSYRANELYWARTGELRDLSKIAPNKPTTVVPVGGGYNNRGNGRQDWYLLTMVSLNYYIPSQIKCRPNNNN